MARTEDGGAIGRAIRWRFRQRMDWLHHVDLAQPRDRGLPKVHDICLYGTLHAGTYPLRELDLRMSDAAILATIHAALADRGRVAAMTRSLRADVLARCDIRGAGRPSGPASAISPAPPAAATPAGRPASGRRGLRCGSPSSCRRSGPGEPSAWWRLRERLDAARPRRDAPDAG